MNTIELCFVIDALMIRAHEVLADLERLAEQVNA